MSGRWRTVRTQAELDKVIAEGDYAECLGNGEIASEVAV
jgi:hypothetical protein